MARPGHWPAAVHLTGFWASPRCFAAAQARALPGEAQRLLPERTPAADGPLCVDLGSMGALGLLPRPALLVAVLEAAAAQLQRHTLLLTGGWQPLLDACRSPRPEAAGQPPWVVPLERPVPHDLLLPRCSALLHHGGAGTVAAALWSGVPQLVCPLHFDAPQWAELVAWLGCGVQLGPAALLQQSGGGAAARSQQAGVGSAEQQQQEVEEAAAALAANVTGLLQDERIRQQCASMQQQLVGEDGLAAAVQLVQRHLEQQQQQQQQPALPADHSTPLHAPPASELEVPGGLLGRPLRVRCLSAAEAFFIHREILEDDCYLSGGISLPPAGAIVVDAGARAGPERR